LASIDRTAYPRFKRVVSARELAEAFTPTPDEITWARGRTHSDEHFLALVVRLKSYQRLGYFPKLDAIPAVVAAPGMDWGELGALSRPDQRGELDPQRFDQGCW
jgi:uncharacterized protein DUF4158